jgi:hypothetical protein
MVADRAHLLLLACFPDISAGHLTSDLNTMHLVALPLVVQLVSFASLAANSIAITIPVGVRPLVGVSSVHERPPTICRTSIEEGPFHLLDRHTIPSIMSRMREMPIFARKEALPISIVRVVAHRLQLHLLASN